MERVELKAAEKKKRVHESGVPSAKIEFQLANFEQHSEALETASATLELNDVYKCVAKVRNSQGSNYPYETALKLPQQSSFDR